MTCTFHCAVRLACLLLPFTIGAAHAAGAVHAAQARTIEPARSSSSQPSTPVFSLGTVSIAPAPQHFSKPGRISTRTPQTSDRRSSRLAQRVAEIVPFRTYSRI